MTNALIDNFLWCALQVTLLAVAGAVLYLLLRRHASLRAALPQWCLAMVVLLSLLVVSPWPSWSWLGRSLSDESQGAQIAFLNAPAELEREQFLLLEKQGFQFKTVPSEEKSPPVEFVPSAPAETATPISFLISRNGGSWKRGFLLLASVSCLLATIRLLLAWRELKQRIGSSVFIEDAQLQEEFSTLHQQYGLTRPVTLHESSYDDIPATIGWRRPSILLPPSWQEWTPEQRSAVLAHELAHIEHHDFATWLAAQVPLLLHSYHPLVHWFARQLRWEQEISADRRAIEVLGDREGYLAALAELALKTTKDHRPRHDYALAPSSSMLLRRLQMLRQNRSEKTPSAPRFKRGLLLASLCAVLLGVSGLRAQAPKNKAVAQPASDKTTATITAMVMISPAPTRRPADDTIFWLTYRKLFQSDIVVRTALGQPQIAETPLVKWRKDRVDWVSKRLKASRIPESPVLRLEFHCPAKDAATGVKIVDALMEVYKQEIDTQQFFSNKKSKKSDEQLEKLTKLHKELSNELRHKIEKYQTLAEEIGGAESRIATAVLNMLINEIRMIKSQIIKKKEELVELDVTLAIAQKQSVNGTSKAEDHLRAIKIEHDIRSGSIEKQIASLEHEYEEKVKEIEQRGVSSGALTMLGSEIEQLQKVESEMEYKLRSWSIDGQPSRQKAIILMPATVTSSPMVSE